MQLSVTELKATGLHKTIEFLKRKKAYTIIATLADDIAATALKVENNNIANGHSDNKDTIDKGSSRPVVVVNTGSKRTREETDNAAKPEGPVKKPSVAAPKPVTGNGSSTFASTMKSVSANAPVKSTAPPPSIPSTTASA